MSFRRIGRSVHPVIRTVADLTAAMQLDEAHWLATAAPVDGLKADPVFLKLLDADSNGRIMCWELRQATEWLLDVLADTAGVADGADSLSFDAINAESEQGRAIRSAAGKILRRDGDDDDLITLGEVRQIKAQVEATSVSEAGVVLPSAAQDTDVQQFLTDIVTALGGAPHPSGASGVDEAQLEAFLAESTAYLDWRQRGTRPDQGQTNEVFPLGAETDSAFALFAQMRPKLEQYFAQCHAAALDESLIGRMGWTPAELDTLDLDDPAAIDRLLTEAPIARARPTLELHFDDAVNPRDEATLEALRRQVIEPILGESSPAMTARQWEQIKLAFAPHEAWIQAQPTTNIAAVDADQLTRYQELRFADAARRLIAESRETAFHLDNIRLVEKLLLYQSGLIALANNFVAFPDLYNPKQRAMFEMGAVIMDGRRFEFAVKVTSRAEHVKMATSSNMYLMYIQVTPRDGAAKFEIAVPVTGQNKGNLCLGKRGIFIDRDGQEHGAQAVYVIENPISLGEAMVAPFVRVGKMLSGKIESIASKAETTFDAKANAAMTKVSEQPVAAPAAPPVAPNQSMASAGMLAGLGVAFAAVGSALAYITSKLSEVKWWQILIVVAGAVLAVLLPTVIVAWMKLRKRDLSAVLEGAGWAVNARMRLTRRQGRVFTHRPRLPLGSALVGGKKARRIIIAILVIAILATAGWLIYDRYFTDADEAPVTQPVEEKPASPDSEKLPDDDQPAEAAEEVTDPTPPAPDPAVSE
jgi:hypothetical protein